MATSLSSKLQMSWGSRAFRLQLQDLVNWMLTLSSQYGYFGIFLISLVGAVSIFFPIPYTVVIFTLGYVSSLDPVLVALAAGFGAAIGEFSGYLLGFGGRRVIGERYKRKTDMLVKVFNKYGWVVILAFALTPLPDDLLFIPLGMMRYSVVRAFVPALIGKVCMNFLVFYGGRLSIGAIQSVFGVDSDWVSALIGFALALVLLIVVLMVMFKVDWETRLEKYMAEQERKKSSRD